MVVSKTEIKKIKKLLLHSQIDISYGGGGTFTKGDNDNSADQKEIADVTEAIDLINWIIENGCN